MATNEDTIVMGNGNGNARPNNNSVPPRPQQQAKPGVPPRPAQPRPTFQPVQNNDGQTWKRVAVGGVAGIMLGTVGAAAATTAYYHFSGNGDDDVVIPEDTTNVEDINVDIDIIAEPTDTVGQHTLSNGLQVAEVDQSLSFSEAFAAARAEVGPGGVFEWHGGVYGTYTADEWNNMSTAEHNQFAHLSQAAINDAVAHHTYHPVDVTHNTHNTHNVVDDDDDLDDDGDVTIIDDEDVEIVGGDGDVAIDDDHDVIMVDVDDDTSIDVDPLADGGIDDGGFDDGLLTDASLPGVDSDGIPDYTNDATGDVLV